jgi:hypothetical protein
MFALVNANATKHLVFSNLTFRDTSYASEGSWSGVSGEPADGALRFNHAQDIVVEACSFLAGLSGYGILVGNYSSEVSVVGNLIEQVGSHGRLSH